MVLVSVNAREIEKEQEQRKEKSVHLVTVLIAEHMGLGNISEEEQHDMDAFTVFVDALHT